MLTLPARIAVICLAVLATGEARRAWAVPIQVGPVGDRPAGTPFYFSLPELTNGGTATVEFVFEDQPAHIELFEETNFTLHVNESNVPNNSAKYSFIFTDGDGERLLGADKDAVELGGFLSGLPVASPDQVADENDPSQLEEERFFHGIIFDLPSLIDLDPLGNGFNAAFVFDQETEVGLWATHSPEPSTFAALGSLLIAGGVSCCRRPQRRTAHRGARGDHGR